MNIIYDLLAREQQFPDTPAPNIWSHPTGIAGGHTWTINNNLVNSFRYGFTREAFTQQGDSADNSISFRFVFSPVGFTRTLARITPVHNFTDDVSWLKGNHSFGFGTNIRLISNTRDSFAGSYDSAITNPSFYWVVVMPSRIPLLLTALLTPQFALQCLAHELVSRTQLQRLSAGTPSIRATSFSMHDGSLLPHRVPRALDNSRPRSTTSTVRIPGRSRRT